MTGIQVYQGGGEFKEVPLEELSIELDQCRLALSVPFSPERMTVIADVSAHFLASRQIISRPALTYFAYWTRRSALRDLSAKFQRAAPEKTLSAPRGLVLHIPPKNVETMFLFSWVISYLVGNANLVRMPSEHGGPVMEAVDLLVERLAVDENRSDLFVRYPADDVVNATLSRLSDVRIVWGGDAKIQAFENLPLRNGGKPIWFGDRYSYAAVSGEALARADSDELAAVARNLGVDIFTFDQMGCSSPHKIYVVGNPGAHGRAVVALTDAIRSEARRRDVEISRSHSVRKVTEALALAGNEQGAVVPHLSGELVCVIFPNRRSSEDRVGGGFIVVEFVSDLFELIDIIRPSHQTLTHYGFSKSELITFTRTAILSGISRIVPIGQALSFDSVWDGYDLLRELTRTIRLD